MEEKLRQISERAIRERVFPGCVVGVATSGNTRVVKAFGSLTYEPDALAVSDDTIYDVASVTKVIPTAALALMFIDKGRVHLQDPIQVFLPELTGRYAHGVTVWHLLTHTISFTQHLSAHKDKTADHILSLVLHTDYPQPPGSTYAYSNAASILLGLVVERVGGKTLDRLASEFIFKPLGMTHSTFSPKTLKDTVIAPTEVDDWRGEVRGVVHDESAYVLQQIMVPGSAGLFSTAPDLLSFAQMILQKGAYDGETYLSSKLIDEMAMNQLTKLAACTGLGWELNQPWFMGENASGKTIGKTGFTGCSIVCDLQKKVGIVILSNCDFPHRPPKRDKINRFRRDVADTVYSHF